MPVNVSLADSVADLIIGLVNYEVLIRGSSTGLREVDRSQTQRARDVRACGQTGEDGQGEIMEARSTGPVDLLDGVHLCVLPGDALLLQAQGDHQLSLREGTDLAALSRRACAAALSEWGGALHRLQAMRGNLPGTGHHHRGGAASQ